MQVMSQITNWILSFLEAGGYLGIVILIALENIFPPLPSEIILPLTGFLVEQDKFSFLGALFAATLGSVLGALLLYFLSRALGEQRVYAFVKQYGGFLGITKDDIKKSITWFHKHGGKLVFFGRVIPTIRSVVSIPAGLADMKLQKFIIYTALGSALWNGVLIAIGWQLGERWQEIQKYTKVLEYIVWVAVVIGVLWLIRRKRRK